MNYSESSMIRSNNRSSYQLVLSLSTYLRWLTSRHTTVEVACNEKNAQDGEMTYTTILVTFNLKIQLPILNYILFSEIGNKLAQ